MILRSVKDIKNLRGKRVLLRVGLDLPLKANKKIDTSDNSRVQLALPTIQYLIKKKAIIILLNHFGRPKGKKELHLKHDGVAKRLEKFVGKKIKKLDEITGQNVLKVIDEAHPGDLIMLENVRFDPREKIRIDASLAKELSQLADVYVNDAFSNSHRNHTSMLGITRMLPSYAGFLVEKEVKALSSVFEKPKRPLVAVMGGAKTETKIGLIKTFLKHAECVLVGGVLANTIIKAKGISVGRSVVDDGMIATVKKINLTSNKLHLPVDIAVGIKLDPKTQAFQKAIGSVSEKEYILDIGPDTIKLFTKIIDGAKTIVWNGPMGLVEYPAFRSGSKSIIEALVRSKCKIVIGGGDSIKIFNMFCKKPLFSYKNIYVSSGGGAMLKFFENQKLPALKPLIKKK